VLSFYIEDVLELKELEEELKNYRVACKKGGFARESDIAFFFDKNQSGFFLAAYKLEEEEIPDCVCASPFIVRVGKNWTKKGLSNIIENYSLFFIRGLPSFDSEMMSPRIIVNMCKQCVRFPWGGFPESKEGQKKLVKWLIKAEKALSLESEDTFSSNRLTISR